MVRAERNASRSLRACVGAAGMWQEGRGRACRCAVAGEGLRQGMGREVGGRASGLRGCGRRAGEGRVVVRGREQIFGGECVVRSVGVRRRCVEERKCSGME